MTIQAKMTMNPANKGLETTRASNVVRDLVKNAFDAVKLPSSASIRSKSSVIVGEEALFSSH